MASTQTDSQRSGSYWVYLILAMGFGGGGSALVTGINDPRPDPWTGEDAARDRQDALLRDAHQSERIKEMRSQFDSRLRSLERHTEEALGSISAHTSGTSGRIERIRSLESQMKNLQKLVIVHQKRAEGVIQSFEKSENRR